MIPPLENESACERAVSSVYFFHKKIVICLPGSKVNFLEANLIAAIIILLVLKDWFLSAQT